MANQQLTLEQLEQLNQISDPVARRRYAVLFQLPQDLQLAFESDITTNNVWSIARDKYDLADGDVGKVARVIGLIFLGELPVKNFIAELKNALGVDAAKAQAIAQDINLAIFQPVRISLMKVHNIAAENPKPQSFTYPPHNNKDQKTEHLQNNNYGLRHRKENILNKIRPMNNGSPAEKTPPTARPAGFYGNRRNIVDLRETKRKNKYNGFFT